MSSKSTISQTLNDKFKGQPVTKEASEGIKSAVKDWLTSKFPDRAADFEVTEEQWRATSLPLATIELSYRGNYLGSIHPNVFSLRGPNPTYIGFSEWWSYDKPTSSLFKRLDEVVTEEKQAMDIYALLMDHYKVDIETAHKMVTIAKRRTYAAYKAYEV